MALYVCEAVAKSIGELHDAERDHAAGFPDRAIELRVSVLHVEYRCAHLRVSKACVSEKKKGKKETGAVMPNSAVTNASFSLNRTMKDSNEPHSCKKYESLSVDATSGYKEVGVWACIVSSLRCATSSSRCAACSNSLSQSCSAELTELYATVTLNR